MSQNIEEKSMSTLFEKLGGAPAVDAAVDIFYRKVLSDDRIADYFDGIDMAAQANKQKSFLTMVFGGPNKYEGKDLRTAHAGMKGLTDIHVDAVIENLGGTLAELGVSDDLISEVAAIANSVRDDVLNR